MIRVCAWCGKHLGEVPGGGVTHGICERCERKVTKEIGRRAKEKREAARC